MSVASFEVIQESVEALYYGIVKGERRGPVGEIWV
jgi:hypothetical protein